MSYQELKRILKADLSRYSPGERKKSGVYCYFACPGFRFTLWFRVWSFFRGHALLRVLGPLATWMVLHQKLKSGIQISPAATIGQGLYIPHFGGIVVNPGAVIGKNLYLSHNVLIGKVHAGPKKGVPTIGEDVFIGAGAAIVGKVTIGDGAAIGINSVVMDDVAAGTFVAGAPAKVVAKKNAGEILGYTTNHDTV